MLATLIASVLSGEATEAIGRTRKAIIVYLAAALLALCGVAFLIGAGFVALAREIGAIPASLWFGGGFIGVAIILVVVHRIASRVRAKRIARRRQTEVKAVASAAALAILPTLLASRGRALFLLAPALAALGYGIYQENRPRRRPGLDDMPED